VAKLHPLIRGEVQHTIESIEAGWPKTMAIRIVQGLRTFQEQDALYAQGRTTSGHIVTNSKAGQSYHNYGLALDFAILYDKDENGNYETLSWDTIKDMNRNGESDWMEVVDAFEKEGYRWGGRFHSIVDQPHFEKTFGDNWRVLLEKYNKKDFIPGNVYVNV
jgi:peptidoglycan L-alanyl-D-glutamate endopeptidase CwlK